MRIIPILTAFGLTVAAAAAYPQAEFQTNLGTITVALESEKAPVTVANFIRYAKSGHFNGIVIYRIVPGFVLQMGSLGADEKWRPSNKPIALENGNGLSNTRGTLAMARDPGKPKTAQAEFFINLADRNAQTLDAKPGDAPNTTGFAVFGHVTAGWDVVDAIAHVPLGGGKGSFPAAYPKTAVIVRKVIIKEVEGPLPPVPPLAPPAEDTDPAAAPAAPAPDSPAPPPAATPQQ